MQNKKKGLAVAAIAGAIVSVPLLAGTASAYTADATGKGFVGKGEVQSAFGLNNAAMQKAVDGGKFSFAGAQATTQAMEQDVVQSGTQSGSQSAVQNGTQSASQAGTQAISQDLTCTFTNGNGTKTFHREGVRDGDREGTRSTSREATRSTVRDASREGERAGSRAGSQSGSIASDVAYENKKTGQYTGFFLRSLGNVATSTGGTAWDLPVYDDWVATGDWSYGDWSSFGDWATTTDYEFGDYAWDAVSTVEWGAWDAAPGEDPSDCLRSQNADHITQISNVVTPGAVIDGDVTEGQVVPGGITEGGVVEGDYAEGGVHYVEPARTVGLPTNVGPLQVSVTFNGITKALTPNA